MELLHRLRRLFDRRLVVHDVEGPRGLVLEHPRHQAFHADHGLIEPFGKSAAGVEGFPQIAKGRAHASILLRQLVQDLFPLFSEAGKDLVDSGAALFGEIRNKGRECLREAIRHLGKGPGVLEQLPDLRLHRRLGQGHFHLKADHYLHSRR